MQEAKKEYYVKEEDLIREIKKYQDSKKESKDGKGIISEELRYYDSKDMHTFFNASKILSDIVIEMNLSLML